MAEDFENVARGDGWSTATLDELGEGWGFRKVRKGLGITAFGANVIVMPPGYDAGRHFHDEQEELYFVHKGTIEFAFEDGTAHELGPGGCAWVDAHTVRKLRNTSESEDAVYLCVGGKDGYVGRDGRLPEGEASPH